MDLAAVLEDRLLEHQAERPLLLAEQAEVRGQKHEPSFSASETHVRNETITQHLRNEMLRNSKPHVRIFGI